MALSHTRTWVRILVSPDCGSQAISTRRDMSDFSIGNDVPVLPTDEPQDAIDRPGSSIDLLLRPGDVVLLDVSHHMDDLYLRYTKDPVELVGELVGRSEYAASAAIENIVHAEPGTDLDLKWG